MSPTQHARVSYKYVPATLRSNKRWYIEYQYQRSDGTMCRVRQGIGHAIRNMRTKAEKRAFGLKYVAEVNQKLSEGWTPEHEEKKAVTGLSGSTWATVRDRYLHHLEQIEEAHEIRHESANTYRSFLRILESWNDSHPTPIRFIWQFDTERCRQWLDWAVAVRGVSESTRKSYRGWLSIFASWLQEMGYVQENIMEGVKAAPKRKAAAVRQKLQSYYIEPELRSRIYAWFHDNIPPMELVCKMISSCLIRPRELAQLQVKHIHLADSLIYIPAEISKNRSDAWVTLPDEVAKLLLDMHYLEHPLTDYLFDSITLRPGSHHGRGDEFRDAWTLMRRALKLPQSIKLYHLKHSGITDMTEALPERQVQLQARHHSIEMTERYIQAKAPKANKNLKNWGLK